MNVTSRVPAGMALALGGILIGLAAAVALLASYIAARRAARIEPMISLRSE